jgi:uncharacterized protein YbaP (TraB family)
MRRLVKLGIAFAVIAVSAAAGSTTAAARDQPAAETQQVDEIVVTARRSGAPVWRVKGPRTTVILVGSIEEVSRDTHWDPVSLTAALRKADRVMFPQEVNIKASPFEMIGYAVRLLRMAKLPKEGGLRSLMSPDQFQRLAALQDRGILKPGFERTHPLHLAIALHDAADGPRGYGLNATDYVKRAVKRYKLKQAPIPRRSVKKPINALFKSRPEAHIPCLLASVSLIEAGGAQAVRARSNAWAAHRVAQVLSSPAARAFAACSLEQYDDARLDWRGAARRSMTEPQITLAVFDLTSLAQPGGLLDEFAAAGFDIQGPAWK